ncbi:MAG: hypothetical protein IJL17_02195 [Kiritimatiellae bacterium]|nr:hypothetical protein [Kiritimatiellia bacterium]
MYQTNIQNQLFSAALPLKPLTAWAGSACSVTVAVPPAPALAGLGVSSVGVTLTLPDGHTVAAAAVQVPGTPLWVATFAPDEFSTAGHVAQGLMITVAGTDEHDVVRTWIVAKGDVDVMNGDAAPVSGGSYYAIKLRDEAPEDPVEGDAYIADGELSIYHDGEWVTIGGGVVADKLDGSAAYPAWISDDYEPPVIVSHKGRLWRCLNYTIAEPGEEGSQSDWQEVTIGDLKQDALSHVQLDAVNSGATSEKVATWDGYAAQIAEKAAAAALRYALVEPGVWEFSGSGVESGVTYTIGEYEVGGTWYYDLNGNGEPYLVTIESSQRLLTVDFWDDGDGYHITATRPSLPGHLCDRAGNRVVVSGETTLTLPAAVPGYLRDFLVRLEISGSTVPTITFAAPTGETIVYETDGDEFPVPDEAGNWVYSFTENCIANTFAVSLKKVNVIAQGGS